MAHVAVKGDDTPIRRAELLYRSLCGGPVPDEAARTVESHLPMLVDRVMGEGSLYAPGLAALALAQTGGDLYEAVLILRAFRSSRPRLAYAEPVGPEHVLTVRRI